MSEIAIFVWIILGLLVLVVFLMATKGAQPDPYDDQLLVMVKVPPRLRPAKPIRRIRLSLEEARQQKRNLYRQPPTWQWRRPA